MKRFARWRQWARTLKRETYVLYLAYKDPRVPWYAKVVAACVVGYALSPIDLIPDFVPVLGYLDDLIIVPLGILLVRRMIPPAIVQEHRRAAQELVAHGKPVNRVAAAIIVTVWLVAALMCGLLTYRFFMR